jgi:uncharacterized protein (DUF433 family)
MGTEGAVQVSLAGDWRAFISGDPAILGGKPVIAGTRVSVAVIVGSIGGGMTVDEVISEYSLTREQVLAALWYAAELADEDRIVSLSPR